MVHNKTDRQGKNNNCPKPTTMAHKLVINHFLPKVTMNVADKDKKTTEEQYSG